MPEPITFIKSATMVKAPMHKPPNEAAIGIYLFNFGIGSLSPPTNLY